MLSSAFLTFLHAAPYDAIHVGAAAPTLPDALVAQLKSPGRMFIPVGTINQAILQVDKDEHGTVTTKELFDVMVRLSFDARSVPPIDARLRIQYVPLTDRKQ